MFAARLRFKKRNNCFISLPKTFLKYEPNLQENSQSLLCIKSLENNIKIHVSWDGTFRNTEDYELDTNFALLNGLSNDSMVIVDVVSLTTPPQCLNFTISTIKPDEFTMLEAKLETIQSDLLNKIRVVEKGLSFPVVLSAYVSVAVKVSSTSRNEPSFVTNLTELYLAGSKKAQIDDSEIFSRIDDVELAFLDSCLGLRGNKCLHHGTMLVCGPKGYGKTHYLDKVIHHYYGIYSYKYDFKNGVGLKLDAIKEQLFGMIKDVLSAQPAILCLDNIDYVLSYDKMHVEEKGFESLKQQILVDSFCQALKIIEQELGPNGELSRVAVIMTLKNCTTLHPRLLAPDGRKFFNWIKILNEPDEDDRLNIINYYLEKLNFRCIDDLLKLNVMEFISKTKSYSPLDLKLLVQKAISISISKKLSNIKLDTGLFDSNKEAMISKDDLFEALDEYIPIGLRDVNLNEKPKRNFSCIGGMYKAKQILTKIVLFPLKYPNLMKQTVTRLQTHVLLHGPPGCGKTLIAEALANEQALNFFCVKGPELFSKYIGGSEAALRNLFERAEIAAPCLVLLDEFDSIAPKRGHDSTGVTDRLVNQLLTIMDGAKRLKAGVHIVAATSRPDLIDPALLRPGRLDSHVYCGFPTKVERTDILKVLSSNIKFESKVTDFEGWSQRLEHFSGADISSFLHTAQLNALHEMIDSFGSSNESSEKDLIVTQNNLLNAYESMVVAVEQRYKQFSKLNPPTITRIPANQVSSRATLA